MPSIAPYYSTLDMSNQFTSRKPCGPCQLPQCPYSLHTVWCGCSTNLYSVSGDVADASEEARTPFDPGPHHPFHPECKATVTEINDALRLQQFYPGARVQVFGTSDTHAANGTHVEGSITAVHGTHGTSTSGLMESGHGMHSWYGLACLLQWLILTP